jgi:hypothetical protein
MPSRKRPRAPSIEVMTGFWEPSFHRYIRTMVNGSHRPTGSAQSSRFAPRVKIRSFLDASLTTPCRARIRRHATPRSPSRKTKCWKVVGNEVSWIHPEDLSPPRSPPGSEKRLRLQHDLPGCKIGGFGMAGGLMQPPRSSTRFLTRSMLLAFRIVALEPARLKLIRPSPRMRLEQAV